MPTVMSIHPKFSVHPDGMHHPDEVEITDVDVQLDRCVMQV